MVLDRSITVGSATPFAVVNDVGQHEGAFKVTAVDTGNNRITVKNLSKAQSAPGTRGFTSATATVVRATLVASVTGIRVNAPKLDIDDVGIVGTSGTGRGIDADGASGYAMASITLGAGTPVIGWQEGARILNGCALFAQEAYLCGNSFAGLNLARATADLDTAFTCGNGSGSFTGYGVVADCGGIRGSRLHSHGNTIGVRLQVGGFVYSDWAALSSNAEAHILVENKSDVQFVGATCLFGGRSGSSAVTCFDGQNGGGGRITGMSCLANYGGTQIGGSGTAAFELNYATVIGNNGLGVSIGRSSSAYGDCVGISTNTGVGLNIEGTFGGTRIFLGGNSGGGIRSRLGGRGYLNAPCALGNSSFDYTVTPDGSYLMADSPVGSPSYGVTINKILGGGALLTNGAQVSMGP